MRVLAALLVVLCAGGSQAGAQGGRTGTIEGHVHLEGPIPSNPRIRMGADPLCGRMYPGERPLQEVVIATPAGDLANVFAHLQGSFPATPAPKSPVVIDQRGCIFTPRVVGIRTGQPLEIRNSDRTSHNAHGITNQGNTFNVSQPYAGITSTVALKNEETMLRVRCDIHSWMTAYVGVVTHPYFAVSDGTGTFRIAGVPPGRHTLRTWHERYGVQTRTVDVKAGQTTKVEITYK
jgi:hypothetical protein